MWLWVGAMCLSQDPYLIGELPDNQILVPFCGAHIARESTARASDFPRIRAVDDETVQDLQH
jgi:hypothetical protein